MKHPITPRIGLLRAHWKEHYKIDLDSLVQPLLFRILCSYLDQGISIWNFPVKKEGFLFSIRELEKSSFASFFKTERARQLLLGWKLYNRQISLKLLLETNRYFEQYLFDQQFSHQGWSGIVSSSRRLILTSLLDRRTISLHDLISF